MKQKKVILLAGPTACGKSDLAIKLAQNINGVIVNADSMQIYREISILTSRPILKDTKTVEHYLYGINTVKKNFSTGLWLQMVKKKIHEQWKKGKTPIIVGGTGLYFKALIEGLAEMPIIPNSFRMKIRKLHDRVGQNNFFSQLIKLDPLSKLYILPTDSQRSIRAYEIKKYTNKSFFNIIKKTKPSFSNNIFKKIFINIPKDHLHKKIEKRVEKMFKDGVITEVEKFLKLDLKEDLSAHKIIGISEIKEYLQKKITLIETKQLIKQKTRQYAKRQFTWARGNMKNWDFIYSSNLNDLFKKTINKIS